MEDKIELLLPKLILYLMEWRLLTQYSLVTPNGYIAV